MNLVPLSTAIIAVSVGEKITTVHIVAGGLIIAGLLISRKAKTRTETASDKH